MTPRWLQTILLAGAIAAGAAQTPSGPGMVAAYSDGNALTFTPPDSIGWDSLLPAELHLDALAKNPALRAQLAERRFEGGSTEVPFNVTLYPALRSRFYYLVDSAGIREVRPAGLKGIAAIEWKGRSDTVEQVRTYGYIRVEVPSTGGFILISPRKMSLTQTPSRLSADSLLAPGGGDYPGKGTPFRSMVRQYQIRSGGANPDRWVFVQWLADSAGVEASCAYRFSLFRFNPEPVQAVTADSGCDV